MNTKSHLSFTLCGLIEGPVYLWCPHSPKSDIKTLTCVDKVWSVHQTQWTNPDPCQFTTVSIQIELSPGVPYSILSYISLPNIDKKGRVDGHEVFLRLRSKRCGDVAVRWMDFGTAFPPTSITLTLVKAIAVNTTVSTGFPSLETRLDSIINNRYKPEPWLCAVHIPSIPIKRGVHSIVSVDGNWTWTKPCVTEAWLRQSLREVLFTRGLTETSFICESEDVLQDMKQLCTLPGKFLSVPCVKIVRCLVESMHKPESVPELVCLYWHILHTVLRGVWDSGVITSLQTRTLKLGTPVASFGTKYGEPYTTIILYPPSTVDLLMKGEGPDEPGVNFLEDCSFILYRVFVLKTDGELYRADVYQGNTHGTSSLHEMRWKTLPTMGGIEDENWVLGNYPISMVPLDKTISTLPSNPVYNVTMVEYAQTDPGKGIPKDGLVCEISTYGSGWVLRYRKPRWSFLTKS